LKKPFRKSIENLGSIKRLLLLSRLRRKYDGLQPKSVVRYQNNEIRITDGPNFYVQCKDEFIQRIYHFEAARPDPLIIDGGSNIGMSILYFKSVYPAARIIGFEPDPDIFALLQENVTRNKLDNVTLINAGLSAESGTATFIKDDKAGGQVGEGKDSITVKVERLSKWLSDPVDFLKLNIEGEELPVLREVAASGKLDNVRELVLEYHGWANGEQRLGDILNLLDGAGFRYLVHDFDHETGHATKPPFKLTPETVWFLLVYAKRVSR
jgi:FkbM family methyltransferase